MFAVAWYALFFMGALVPVGIYCHKVEHPTQKQPSY